METMTNVLAVSVTPRRAHRVARWDALVPRGGRRPTSPRRGEAVVTKRQLDGTVYLRWANRQRRAEHLIG
jgi:hypothetical protein